MPERAKVSTNSERSTPRSTWKEANATPRPTAKWSASSPPRNVARSKGSLEVDLSGAGRVAYYGSPTVTDSISGAGAVEALGSR